jgi:hypothetical protein
VTIAITWIIKGKQLALHWTSLKYLRWCLEEHISIGEKVMPIPDLFTGILVRTDKTYGCGRVT